jgi:thymidylate synthase (FAD)
MPKIIMSFSEVVNNLDPEQIMYRIEESARISHRSEDKITDDSWKRFIQAIVIDHADWSVTEHVMLTVDITTDRGITHELVRHRIASYTQESTRFVNYEKKMPPAFIYPIPNVICKECLSGNEVMWSVSKGLWGHMNDVGMLEPCEYEQIWLSAIARAEQEYKRLLAAGWRPQEARSVLPNALAAKIRVSTNLRAWREIFLKRTTKEAHPQMLDVMVPLLAQFKQLVPLLFDDIVPGETQANNMRLPS